MSTPSRADVAPTSPSPEHQIAPRPFGELLGAIAAKTPSPGGGAVACATGALAAATGGMVVAYSLGRKDLSAHQTALAEASAYLERARGLFLTLAAEDAGAYAWLNALQKLPPDDARRASEMPAAIAASVAAPLACLAACADLRRLIGRLRPITNPRLVSDLDVAAILAKAAGECAACNVRVNLSLLSPADAARTEAAVADLLGAR
ncbi:MAG: cyclodeaminase/cyclohydrolase family protein [Phycisphaerales bacterium]